MNDANIVSLLRRLLRGSGLFAFAIYLSNAIFFRTSFTFMAQSTEGLILWMVLQVIPVACYLLAIVFYVSRWRLIRVSSRFGFRVAFLWLILSSPGLCGFVVSSSGVSRQFIDAIGFNNWGPYLIWIPLLSFIAHGITRLGFKFSWLDVVDNMAEHLLEVFWWAEPQGKDLRSDISVGSRDPLYINQEKIRLFQKHLTCLRLEASWLANCTMRHGMLNKEKFPNLRILDLGCGDGLFMGKLLTELQNRADKPLHIDVYAVDACDFERDYLDNVKEKCNSVKYTVANIENYFQTDADALSYNLVLGSHSFYGPFDKARTVAFDIEAIGNALWNLCSPEGAVYLSMTSEYSSSFRLKKQFLCSVYPDEPNDASYENSIHRIVNQIRPNANINVINEDIIDSVIRVPQNSNETIQMFEYFIRCAFSDSKGLCDLFNKFLSEHCMVWKSVPEAVRKPVGEAYTDITLVAQNELHVLLHKTKVTFLGKGR
jgi:SAM-dependent methyltransferase